MKPILREYGYKKTSIIMRVIESMNCSVLWRITPIIMAYLKLYGYCYYRPKIRAWPMSSCFWQKDNINDESGFNWISKLNNFSDILIYQKRAEILLS